MRPQALAGLGAVCHLRVSATTEEQSLKGTGVGRTGRTMGNPFIGHLQPLARTNGVPIIACLVTLGSIRGVHATSCWEAYTPHFQHCLGYSSVGYTCVGDYCAAVNPAGDPEICAVQTGGCSVDPATGRCVACASCAPFSTTHPTTPDGYVVPNTGATTAYDLGIVMCANGYEATTDRVVSGSFQGHVDGQYALQSTLTNGRPWYATRDQYRFMYWFADNGSPAWYIDEDLDNTNGYWAYFDSTSMELPLVSDMPPPNLFTQYEWVNLDYDALALAYNPLLTIEGVAPSVSCDGNSFSEPFGCQKCTPFSTTYPTTPSGYIVPNVDATSVDDLGPLACAIGYDGTPIVMCDGKFYLQLF